ncbi:hypothetical protein GCM10023195_16500 [Actinoallomurus liliacearum]|uniref:Uncharacterized protein n=1 Tax=Actinoallomurus liliacearum TaxID=1080073 RepID=A0ABP8TFV2_9ACTN
MVDVQDRVCRFASLGGLSWGVYAEENPSPLRRHPSTGHTGGQSLLPLSDTSCGADTVPGFVNPLLAVLTVSSGGVRGSPPRRPLRSQANSVARDQEREVTTATSTH